MHTIELLQDVLRMARAKGADEGDAALVEEDAFEVKVRLGGVDTLKNAREQRLGLRLFIDKGYAAASTSDLSRDSLAQLVDDTCALARATARDELAGLPPAEDAVGTVPDLDLYDPDVTALSVEERIELARRAEGSALEADARIANSEGGEFADGTRRVLYANTNGFGGEYRGTSFMISATPVAVQDGEKQRDYWYAVGRRFRELEPADTIGRTAAERALRRLGARKVKTQEAPVVFDPETAASLLRSLANAASGYALYRRASFLVGRLGDRIASDLVSVSDDATMAGALGSRPFDGEGLPSRRIAVVERGVLRSYLLDTYSARKLGLRSTGSAARLMGQGLSAGPTNFSLTPGPHAPEEIIRSVRSGLYVTELIGFGVNLVTGDYSRGAVGLWIEEGEMAYPVEEITIAGNLKEMLLNIEMVGDDLRWRGTICAPTVKIARMTIAGH